MELREWLIILGLVLVTTIVIDGVRRLQRQRRVPRLDQATHSQGTEGRDAEEEDPEKAAREAEINWELPNGGARVVGDATFTRSGEREPVRPESPLRQERIPEEKLRPSVLKRGHDRAQEESATESRRPGMRGMKDAMRAGAQRMSASAQRFTASFQHDERDDADEHPHHEPTLGAAPSAHEPERESQAPAAASPRSAREDAVRHREAPARPAASEEAPAFRATSSAADDVHETQAPPYAAEVDTRHQDVVTDHPAVERAKRNPVHAERARDALSDAEEVIVISVLSRDEGGFHGPDLLNLMLACGLRYCHEMGVFHRFETESDDSALQFTMVNVLKPGVFDLDGMDDFVTPGVTFLMPLPSAHDSAAAFEAMFETAMVLVRNLGGELKDENRSVMTAQTVEFARQRVQEFERRHRLHRYQAN